MIQASSQLRSKGLSSFRPPGAREEMECGNMRGLTGTNLNKHGIFAVDL